MEFTQLIRAESAKLQALHAAVHRTVIYRYRDAHFRQEWLSAIDGYLERACQERRYFDSDLLEFEICFLKADPWFFGSGYFKQKLITRLKRSDLGKSAAARLWTVLVDAVNRRGTREFKRYCRTALPLATQEFVCQLELVSHGIDRARASRARMMLSHIARRAAVDAFA